MLPHSDVASPQSGGLSDLQIQQRYRTGSSNPIEDFYRPCLLNASSYDRAVGYFRSSIYLVVGPATIEFARRGGKIRLICSPSLESADTDSIEEGYDQRAANAMAEIYRDIEALLADDESSYRTKVLATLIAVGAMDIKIATRPKAYGLYHEKIGIFGDRTGSAISFIGSANETWNGWHEEGNFESIEVFCTWNGLGEAARVERHRTDFESLWKNIAADVDVTAFSEAIKLKLLSVALPDLESIDLSRFLQPSEKNFTSRRKILPHQHAAIEAWKSQGRTGIFKHATGSGKTFTALSAVKEHTDQGLPALILVPSLLLLKQWEEEIKVEVPDAIRILAGAGNNGWRQGTRLKSLTAGDPGLGGRIVLATMQTASTEAFLNGISQGTHLMMVADEVHQIGSPKNSKSLQIKSGSRLGLSATPERYGDPDGTAQILAYFGPIVQPEITLQDAISAGRLVEYQYFPHPIRLTADEAENWKAISKSITLEVARSRKPDGSITLSDRAKMMLINRSRIAKKAANKIRLAVETVRAGYVKGDRWIVYCEDVEQMREVRAAIEAEGFASSEYHSDMEGDKAGTLDWFRTFGGILASIRCLDEGVDIPAISHALILASSQNPRQFIQRRGRVLRKWPGKQLAVIHDAIVVPVYLADEPEQLALLRAEFIRAIEFAKGAINLTAGVELREIAMAVGFDPDMSTTDGIEEDNEE